MTNENEICKCGGTKNQHCDELPTGKLHCHHLGHSNKAGKYKCPCKKFEPQKSKLFPSKEIKGMLTDGQGAYYPDDKPQNQSQGASTPKGRLNPDTLMCKEKHTTLSEKSFNQLGEFYFAQDVKSSVQKILAKIDIVFDRYTSGYIPSKAMKFNKEIKEILKQEMGEDLTSGAVE